MNYTDQLQEIKKIISSGRWIKEAYFKAHNDLVCCCIHGAGEIVSNPKIKSALMSLPESGICNEAPMMAKEAGKLACGRFAARAGAYHGEQTLDLTWKNRPDWVKDKSRNQSLHFLLGMFGLTAEFNDHQDTTIQMVLNKLDECITWTAKNEKFLQEN